MSDQDLQWQKISEQSYSAGFRKMLRRKFKMPDGKIAEYDLNHNADVVCILALTSDNKVILAKQFRPAQEMVLLEIPGGGVEEGETPHQAAARELVEETGYSGELQFVGKSLQSAYDTLVRHNFVATNCSKVQDPNLDDLEYIETVEMPLQDFKEHLKSDQLTDVATGYLGLEFLKL